MTADLGMPQGLGGLLRAPVLSAAQVASGVQGQPRAMGKGSLSRRS